MEPTVRPFESRQPYRGHHPSLLDEHALIERWEATWTVESTEGTEWLSLEMPRDTPQARAISRCPEEMKMRMGLALLSRLEWGHYSGQPLFVSESAEREIGDLVNKLVKSAKQISETDVLLCIDYWEAHPRGSIEVFFIAEMAQKLTDAGQMTPEIARRVKGLPDYEWAVEWHTRQANAKREANRWMVPFTAPQFSDLLHHAAKATSAKASPKWLQTAEAIIARTGAETFLDAFEKGTEELKTLKASVPTESTDLARGLAWFAGLTRSPRAAPLLATYALAGAAKEGAYGQAGYRCLKGFNAAVAALERLETFEALAQLSKINGRVRDQQLRKATTEALERSARAQDMPLEELEELIVPDFGLEQNRSELEIGPAKAVIEITGTASVRVRWFRGSKESKAPPKEVKENYAEDLKTVRALAKEIEQTLLVQRSRIERLYLVERSLPVGKWRERYLNHPLLAHISRRLIWRFREAGGEQTGMAPFGELIGNDGSSLSVGQEAMVSLWHPLHSSESETAAWRDFLISQEISQPFKQAHREVYRITTDDLLTDLFSSRFADHVLKQHQMASLIRQRGWKFSLYGWYDLSGSTPSLRLGKQGLTAEFHVDPGPISSDDEYVNDSGFAHLVVSGQVRFLNERAIPVPLSDVPRVVFSEVMRDVDLFVGVSTIANDPKFGELPQHHEYWYRMAQEYMPQLRFERRILLERVLPRMKVAEVARLTEHELVIEGSLRTYKIHIGTGEVTVMPGNSPLVMQLATKGEPRDEIYLPFEGEAKLREILEKAVMLADDKEITDPDIVRQISAADLS